MWLILLSYIAFVSLGLPDGLLGVAWPSIRATFEQPLDALGMLLVAGTTGYMVSSFLSGWLTAMIGVGGLLSASSAATATALIGYTIAPSWPVIVAFGFLSGIGAGAIDAGLNSYVESHFDHVVMQWLHASFGIGITLGPFIMTWGLVGHGSWRFGYIVVAVAQILLAAAFIGTAPLWKTIRTPSRATEPATGQTTQPGYSTPALPADSSRDKPAVFAETLRYAPSWASATLFFLYTGVEIGLGHWAYTLLTESRGIDPGVAGFWTGSYWATFTVGRILAGVYTTKIGPTRLVRFGLLLAVCGAALLWWNPAPWTGLFGITLIGFSIAPIFPALVSTTSSRVGKRHTTNTIGMQMAFAGLGVAVLPAVAGVLAQRYSIEIIPPFVLGVASLLFVLREVIDAVER